MVSFLDHFSGYGKLYQIRSGLPCL
jgi:hypothetical protein